MQVYLPAEYTMTNMDIQKEVEQIKKELVDLIVLHLKANKMEAQTAQKLAADFLAILPVKDQKDLLDKLGYNNWLKLSQDFK